MTKHVRIENADTSDYKVVVQIWRKEYVANGQPPLPDVLVKEIRLDYPTAMTGQDCYLTKEQYLVVKEV